MKIIKNIFTRKGKGDLNIKWRISRATDLKVVEKELEQLTKEDPSGESVDHLVSLVDDNDAISKKVRDDIIALIYISYNDHFNYYTDDEIRNIVIDEGDEYTDFNVVCAALKQIPRHDINKTNSYGETFLDEVIKYKSNASPIKNKIISKIKEIGGEEGPDIYT